MITKDSAASATQPSGTPAAPAQDSVPLVSARGVIEAASTGTGTVTDPGGMDRQPPNAADFELLV